MCDFAQFYHVMDWRALPLHLAATLAGGLPTESRCRARERGMEWPMETVLLAKLHDYVELLLWVLLKGGQEGAEPPKGVLNALLGRKEPETESQVQGFESGEAFMQAWRGG